MTEEEILNMPAGRKIDALIAEKIKGLCVHNWKVVDFPFYDNSVCYECSKCKSEYWGLNPPKCKPYSSDISDAWRVVDEMNKHYGFEIISHYPGKDCIARFWQCDPDMPVEKIAYEYTARADTVSLAICRAALLTVLGD